MRNICVVVLALGSLTLAGCCKKGDSESSKGSSTSDTASPATAATTTANPTAVAAGQKRFAGAYSSNWGQTTFEEAGSTVTAKYPRGTLTCTAGGDVLSCSWLEGTLAGKAHLERQSNGDLKGTWGNGTSESNGGAWNFTRLGEGAAASTFAGTYTSTWGTTTFQQNGSAVTAKYPRGTLSCIASGMALTCDWFEGSSRGKAALVKNADGSISGSWGNGSSATNGGPWRFSPK